MKSAAVPPPGSTRMRFRPLRDDAHRPPRDATPDYALRHTSPSRRARATASSVASTAGRRSRHWPRALNRAAIAASVSPPGLAARSAETVRSCSRLSVGQGFGDGAAVAVTAPSPRVRRGIRGVRQIDFRLHRRGRTRRATRRVLEVRPQPADPPLRFLGSTPGVECDEPFEQRLGPRLTRSAIGPGHRHEIGPAIGGEHGRIEIVVQALQHPDEAVRVQRLVLRGERLAGAQLREHVVEASQRDGRMRRLPCLAMGVDLFGERSRMRSASSGARPVSSSGKGKVSKQRVLT